MYDQYNVWLVNILVSGLYTNKDLVVEQEYLTMEHNTECINQTKDIAEDIDTIKEIVEDNVEHG